VTYLYSLSVRERAVTYLYSLSLWERVGVRAAVRPKRPR
jgi:hypothetical protein